MPQWAGSCWYELRYLDPTNENRFVDPEVERYWMGPQRAGDPGGVDLYVGGVEHAVLHLLYARFWHKVLYDLGHVSSGEPFHRLFNQGYIQACGLQGRPGDLRRPPTRSRSGPTARSSSSGRPVTRECGKMGKSLKNAVAPDDIYDDYGADTLRLYEMSMGPLDTSRPWEHPRRRRLLPVPAASSGATWSTRDRRSRVVDEPRRRRDPAAAAPHHRPVSADNDGPALQHRDRQADRAEQPPHQGARRPRRPRGGRAAGADAGPAHPARRRGAVGPAGPRPVPGLSSPSRRPIRRCWSTTPSSTRCR